MATIIKDGICLAGRISFQRFQPAESNLSSLAKDFQQTLHFVFTEYGQAPTSERQTEIQENKTALAHEPRLI